MKSPKICIHYGLDSPLFRPLIYLTKEGLVIYCQACGRRIADKNMRRAVRRWNREVRRKPFEDPLPYYPWRWKAQGETYGISPLEQTLEDIKLLNVVTDYNMRIKRKES